MNELSWLAWTANVILVIGLWLVGSKKWYSFLFTIVGEIAWVIVSVARNSWDMASICAVFALLAFINLFRWEFGNKNKLEKRG